MAVPWISCEICKCIVYNVVRAWPWGSEHLLWRPGNPCWGAPLLSPPRLQELEELGAHPGSPCSEIQVDSAPLGNTQKTLGLQTSRKLKDWFLGEGAS